MNAATKKESNVAKRSPLPIDVLVGQNIRICRLQKGLSQGELGRRIGVTFQQVQKYEKGANRVGASRLTQIADVLGVPIPTLFDGAPTAGQAAPEQSPRYLLAKPHSLRLLQGFDRIDNDATRLAVLHLVESLMHTPAPRGAASKREGSRRRA
jgi:transcriptional regulator with XRE-family HTH domain